MLVASGPVGTEPVGDAVGKPEKGATEGNHVGEATARRPELVGVAEND
jgi:hypothetical protein